MNKRGDDVLTRVLAPGLDERTERNLRREIGEAVAAGSRRIVIDLLGTDVVETATLRTLIRVSRIVREYGGDVGIVAAREQARATLSLTGLDKVFAVYRSASEAAGPA